jgi:hypothetical protein
VTGNILLESEFHEPKWFGGRVLYHNPFGEADCLEEVKLLKGEYSDLYFNEAPFNQAALDRNTYLIIGRRGSGKTALS